MTDTTTDSKVSDLEAKLNDALKSIEALTAKNKELLAEKKSAKEAAEQAEAEREAAEEEKARSSNDLKALEERLTAKHAREIAKLQRENETANAQLKTLLIDNAISTALDGHNVLPQFKKAVTAMIKAEATLEGGEAVAGGLPLSDYIKDFVSGDDGKVFVAADANGGSGGTTSQKTVTNGTKWTNPPKTGEEIIEWAKWAPENPQLASSLADNWNMPHLKP